MFSNINSGPAIQTQSTRSAWHENKELQPESDHDQ